MHLYSLTETEIALRLERSIQLLLKKDAYILLKDLNERTITHRLAIYLEEQFTEWNVDCEYNRDGDRPKYLNPIDFGNTRIRLDDTDAKTAYPDIIVHIRGTNIHNLLVIEVKKFHIENGVNDLKKLALFKNDPYNYQHSCFLRLGVKADVGRYIYEFV